MHKIILAILSILFISSCAATAVPSQVTQEPMARVQSTQTTPAKIVLSPTVTAKAKPTPKPTVSPKRTVTKPRIVSKTPKATKTYSPRPKPSQTKTIQTVKAVPKPSLTQSSVWDKIAKCESGGNWSINTGNGFYGGLQFTLSSWRAVGGSGYPHQASKSEQIKRAEILQDAQGWGAWPLCSIKAGLR